MYVIRYLRSQYGRITKTKSGQGTKKLTQRDQYIKDRLSFLSVHIIRKPNRVPLKPLKGVSRLPPQAYSPEPCPEVEAGPSQQTAAATAPSGNLKLKHILMNECNMMHYKIKVKLYNYV